MAALVLHGGTYVLWIDLPRALTLEAGGLGRVALRSGVHLYVGSARRAMAPRVARHLTRSSGPPQPLRGRALATLEVLAPPRKKAHWHIDHLLELSSARVYRVSLLPGTHCECELVLALVSTAGARASVPRFGASDCSSGCGAHLLLLPRGRRRQARRLVAAAGEVRELGAAGYSSSRWLR